MASLPQDAEASDVPKTKPNKGLFQFSINDDSDDEEHRALQYLSNATSARPQEQDIFEESVQDILRGSQHQVTESQGETHAPRHQQLDEPTDLVVSHDENEQERDSQNKLAPGFDSDHDLMIIDKADASSDAQVKWDLPRGPWIVDLVTEIKQEQEHEIHPCTDNPTTSVKQEQDGDILSQSQVEGSVAATGKSTLPLGAKPTADSELLEQRRAQLQSKALHGPLSQEELNEFLQLVTQHQTGNGEGDKNAKSKKEGKAPMKSAADYWAQREADEREAKRKQRDRDAKSNRAAKERKRRAKGCSGRETKRSKTSAAFDQHVEDEVEKQINEMLRPNDAIEQRARLGDLPAEPVIDATRTIDQLKQMQDAAPEYLDRNLLKDQKRELKESLKAWGPGRVRPKNGRWEIRNVLRSPLMNHQIVVGAWMMGRELRQTPDLPLGGILADAMGLGKTIETLSCISGNRPSEKLKESGKGATLVVCPSIHMIGVWVSEIKKHCPKRFARDMVIYKPANKMDIEFLGALNIVFTTYSQLRASTPSAKLIEEMRAQMQDSEYKEWLEEHTGDLHHIDWYRVVLDEAHSIKNHNSHGAFACFQLKSKYRWIVSGTPLINSDIEFFSPFKFLQCKSTSCLGDYLKEYHDKAQSNRYEKRNKLVEIIMYRRTQNDWFLGQPILNLPATHPTHQYLQLSREESVIFRMMERCFRRRLNQELGLDEAERQIKVYLVMLLRLRQAATHPFLLEGMMAEYFNIDDLRTTKRRLAEIKGKDTIYSQIGSWNKRHDMSNERMIEVIRESEKTYQERLEAERQGDVDWDDEDNEADGESSRATPTAKTIHINPNSIVSDDYDEVDSQDEVEEDSDGMVPEHLLPPRPFSINRCNSTTQSSSANSAESQLEPFGRSDFGLNFDMDRQLEYLERLEELNLAKCVVCKQEKPENPTKGQCGCVFHTGCLTLHFATKGRKCPGCRKLVGVPKMLAPFHAGDTDEDSESGANASGRRRKRNDKDYGMGFDHYGFQPCEADKKGEHPMRFLQIGDKRRHLPVTPSAKTTALKETILRWQEEAPDDKIIIFSQFSVVMKVVGRMLEGEGIPFSYISGKQSTEQRDKSVEDFQKDNIVKVLVVSLRAGGQCLNLTRGNRVILMEMWWNHAVEQQAFSRVFRIGQIKETHFVRFIVNTPIEKRMLGMQVDKILRIDAALQDATIRVPKIGLEDIAKLFGRVTHKKGTMRVVADYSDGEDDEDDPYMPGSRAAAAVAAQAEKEEEDEEGDLEGFVVPDDESEQDGDDEEHEADDDQGRGVDEEEIEVDDQERGSAHTESNLADHEGELFVSDASEEE